MSINIIDLHEILYNHYGNLNWWPANSPFEVMVGAILTQNTAWGNVEKAIANFAGKLSPSFVERVPKEDLIEIIRPAGFFNQKTVYLKTLTAWYKTYDYSVESVKQQDVYSVRKELLSLKGIGPETADCILIYAFGFPSFAVDAYTIRLLTRLEIDVKMDYKAIKTLFESNIPRDTQLYNNFHAMIVINAKEHCKAKPFCDGCPLQEICPFFLGIGR